MFENPFDYIKAFDERRDIAIPGGPAETIAFITAFFIFEARQAIQERGLFAVALSGGSTPQSIYQRLAEQAISALDWNKVLLFWSDERCVPKDNPSSNYKMAMQAGLNKLPIPNSNIFPMPAEDDLERQAQEYEQLIFNKIPNGIFDLMMLGVGDDGHTASLFPLTHALHTNVRWVVPNFITEKDIWRMTMTFDCINTARQSVVLALGSSKASIVKKVLSSKYDPDHLPAQRVGTTENKSLWILDKAAASQLP